MERKWKLLYYRGNIRVIASSESVQLNTTMMGYETLCFNKWSYRVGLIANFKMDFRLQKCGPGQVHAELTSHSMQPNHPVHPTSNHNSRTFS